MDRFKKMGWPQVFILVSLFLGLLSFVIPVYWIMAGIVALLIVGYLAMHLDKAFYLLLFTIPFVERSRIFPFSFSLNDVMIVFCLMSCIFHQVIRPQKINFKTGIDGWIVVLSILFFLAGAFSESETGLLGFLKVVEAFVVYYMVVYLLNTRQITRVNILKTLLWTALFQACVGMFQSVTGIGSDFASDRGYLGYLGIGSNHVWHGLGTTGHFNTLGNYLVTNLMIFLPLTVAYVKKKPLVWISTSILILGIITTYSRGSMLGFLAGMIFFLAVRQPTIRKALQVAGAFVVLGVLPVAYKLMNSSSYMSTVSYQDRLIIWQVPIAAITSSPRAFWLGSGLNAYNVVAWPFIPATIPEDQYHNWFAHNFYLLTIIEIGMIGAAIFFSFLIWIWLDTLIKFKKGQARGRMGFRTVYSLSISTAMTTVFFVSIFDHTFAAPHFKVLIFILLGLLYVKRPATT